MPAPANQVAVVPLSAVGSVHKRRTADADHCCSATTALKGNDKSSLRHFGCLSFHASRCLPTEPETAWDATSQDRDSDTGRASAQSAPGGPGTGGPAAAAASAPAAARRPRSASASAKARLRSGTALKIAFAWRIGSGRRPLYRYQTLKLVSKAPHSRPVAAHKGQTVIAEHQLLSRH